ncbi:secretory phospholipase A2 receptor [Hoplias malabaricus]|uniref:secretory phospholipase A2 receptor n=1 Tax=Hoplias malabaricus TaxID=27720 RepID=UPI0034621B89
MRGHVVSVRPRSEGVPLVFLLFTALVLSRCGQAATEYEVLDRSQLAELYNKGVFLLESVSLKKCLSADSSGLSLTSCDRPTAALLWKWVSRHRFFNLGTSLCLGINATQQQQPETGMYECDVHLHTMWWRCRGNVLYGATNNKLSVMDSKVVVKKDILHEWRIYGAAGEAPCAYPYQEIHTLLGNVQGMPCALPFQYNNKWYWDCTSEGREDLYLWCATTSRYDQHGKWGFCPTAVSGCGQLWETNAELKACYQFNLNSLLTWSQALTSCQAQGGSLLSITHTAEQIYIKERLSDMGVMVWTGLNHLADAGGWQWSDGSPLALIQYIADMPLTAVQQGQRCGVFNSGLEQGHWQSLSCESALPYICKKTPNDSRRAEPIDNWQYKQTVCPDGWDDHNGFCYQLVSERSSWDNSSKTCTSLGAQLTSIRSLSELEMLLTLIMNASDPKVWIGMSIGTHSPAVEWSDHSMVTLTSWNRQEPSYRQGDKRLCVSANRKDGNWQLEDCEKKHPAVCRTSGLVPLHPTGEWDEGCPEGWKRKGHFCYMIADQEQTFEDAARGYYCKAPLVTTGDRFEQAFLNSLINVKNRSVTQFYWTALQDQNRSGEYRWLTHNSTTPLTYTNWNQHQPSNRGGCVVMTGGHSLGHWEVKNCNSHKALAVCKQSVSSYHDVLTPGFHIDILMPCKDGWESSTGLLHCYKVFHSEKILMSRSWSEAEFFCRALGADLASFHHYRDQVFVKEILTKMFDSTEGRWFWVGFTKRDPQSAGAWEWSDGTPVVTSFIEDRNDEATDHECAAYSDQTNTLTPQPCDAKFEWICKVPRGVELTKPYWYNDQPWVFYRGAEYIFASQTFPWHSVSFACKMMGADLLSLHSKDELNFVKERMNKVSHISAEWWIGLSSVSGHEGFSWTDGTALDYENWRNGRPLRGAGKDCITMSTLTGEWSTAHCADLHGYVCKRRTVSVMEIPREPYFIGACPENWFYFGHKCLLLHLPAHPEEGKSWTDAQSICTNFHGTLVAIENEIEQAYITMLLHGQSLGVWIGLRDADTMKWTSGKPVTYTNWSPVEPKSSLSDDWMDTASVGAEPLCTVLSNNHNFHFTGKWYDEKCSQSGYGFVCQKPQDKSKRPSHTYHDPASLDSSQYRNQNYRVVHGNMSWYEAQNHCVEKMAELVSITDPYHQAYLTVLVNRLGAPHWIGLYSEDDGINYQWSDSSDTVFTHWAEDDGDEGFVLGNCVYMDVTGGWRRANCDRPLQGALCYLPTNKISAFSNDVVCPKTWLKFRGSCYNFDSVGLSLSLKEAREHCRKKDNSSDVLTIRDEEENHFFLEQMKTFYKASQKIWLDIYFNDNKNALTWMDGTALSYTNWRFKAPDGSVLRTDTCVSMQVSNTEWFLTNCTARLGFICKTRSEVVQEVKVEPVNVLHSGIVPVAILVAILFFALLVGGLWIVYRRNTLRFHRLPTLGSAYYRQSSSQATDSDGNVLLTHLETGD